MSDTTTLLKRHKAWRKGRKKLSKMEGKGDFPSSSQWQNSDDEGVQIGEEAIELLRQPVKIWTLALADDDRPDMHPLRVTVHPTEEACWEHLREQYDPEGMADDEPPVAIVGHLENEGWVINIDVHEVSRS
jgi:hypothetical protein